MSQTLKILNGFGWLVGGRFSSTLISILSTAILARLLTPADFGKVAAIFIVLSLANVVFDGAFGLNLIRKRNLRAKDLPTTLTVALLAGLLLAALVVAVAPAAAAFFDIPLLTSLLPVAAIVVPMKALQSVGASILLRAGRFPMIAGATLLGQFVGNILVAVSLALAGFGVWALVAGLVVTGSVEALATARAARLPLKPAFDREALADIGDSSLFSLANAFNWMANTASNMAVGRGLSVVDLGYYSRAWKLLDLVVHAGATPLTRVLLPTFAAFRDRPEAGGEAFLRALNVAVLGYTAASVLLVLQTPAIVAIALGDQWSAVVPLAQILFAALLPRCAFKVAEVFAIASGRSASAVYRQGAYALLMVVGSVAGLQYGLLGVAVAVSIAISLFYLLSLLSAVTIANVSAARLLPIHGRAVLFAGLVAIVDVGVLRLTNDWHVVPSHALAGGLAGLSGLFLLLAAPRFWIDDASAALLKTGFAKLRKKVRGNRG